VTQRKGCQWIKGYYVNLRWFGEIEGLPAGDRWDPRARLRAAGADR